MFLGEILPDLSKWFSPDEVKFKRVFIANLIKQIAPKEIKFPEIKLPSREEKKEDQKKRPGHTSGVRKKTKTKEVKDSKGKVKSSSKFLQNLPDTDDDVDNMVDDNDSFDKRLGIDSSSSDLFKPKKKNFFDDLSSDEEYQNMTEKERNEKLAPKISQLDGNCDSSDDDEITSSKK